jgi:uncharacterized protein involved in outer membrane biogenesis
MNSGSDSPTPGRRFPRWAAVLAAFAVAVLVALILFRWDWLIPFVEARASAAIGRTVTIEHLHVSLGRTTTVVADEVDVANPDGFAAPVEGADHAHFAHAAHLGISVDVWGYLQGGGLNLTSINLDHPDVVVATDAQGKPNYDLSLSGGSSDSSSSPPTKIGDLRITDGAVHVDIAKLRAKFDAAVATREAEGDKPAALTVDAKGTYAGQPITAQAVGGALLTLRDDASPYPIDLHVANGPTTVALHGTVQDPLHFKGTNVSLVFAGPDMSLLKPLTGVPIPRTPPYRVAGALAYADGRVRFEHFTGTLGRSDIGGTIAVAPGAESKRQTVEAQLESRRVDLDDLGGFIGATPGDRSERGETAAQRQQIARAEASPKLLPDTPIDVPALKAADVHLTYHAGSIEGRAQPFTDLRVALDIDDGAIRVHPLSFGVGRGNISADIGLTPVSDNATRIHTDIAFQRVDIAQLMRATPGFTGAGLIGGRAVLDATGRSLGQFLGNGSGELKLFTSGGNLSALLVALSGLQFGNAVISALGIPTETQLRCMVVDMPLTRGVLSTRVMLIDTNESNINGAGTIDLAHERVDYKIETEAKHFSIGSLPAPIAITGPLKSPSIGPEAGPLAARGGAAVALGVFLTPLAALIPTIQLGLGEDNDCSRMIAGAARGGPAAVTPAQLRARAGTVPARRPTAAHAVPRRRAPR